MGKSYDGQKQYLLTATLNPSAPSGAFKHEIIASTNDSNSPTIPIPVAAQVRTAVTVSPSIINLGHVRPGEVIKKRVLVRSSAAQPFRLTTLKANKDDLTATPDSES